MGANKKGGQKEGKVLQNLREEQITKGKKEMHKLTGSMGTNMV